MNGGHNGPKTLHILKSAWFDSTVSWNKPWKNPGGDFDSIPFVTHTNATVKTWETFEITEPIQKMVSKTVDNNGFLIKVRSHDPPRGVRYYSSRSVHKQERPKLVITYIN